MGILKERLPETLSERDDIAYNLVPEALRQVVGPQEEAWHTERRATRTGQTTTFVVAGSKPSG
jgi:hypothetical protein